MFLSKLVSPLSSLAVQLLNSGPKFQFVASSLRDKVRLMPYSSLIKVYTPPPCPLSKVLRNRYTVWKIKVELFFPIFQTVIAEKCKKPKLLVLKSSIFVELFKIFIKVCVNNA